MHVEIAFGLRKIAEITGAQRIVLGCDCGIAHQCQPRTGLHVRAGRVERDQRHARIDLNVFGVLGDGGNQDERIPGMIKHERRNGAEWIAFQPGRDCRKNAAMRTVKEFAGFGG